MMISMTGQNHLFPWFVSQYELMTVLEDQRIAQGEIAIPSMFKILMIDTIGIIRCQRLLATYAATMGSGKHSIPPFHIHTT
jgi:hypothetical protein